ncbi:MAG: hypothetical protein AAFU77_00290 [Myxococcota bacterium]
MRRRSKHERGLALMVVLLTLALVTSVVVEFQYSSSVDLQLAYNARDELQAEYNALTALRMRAMLLKESRTLQRALNDIAGSLGGGDAAQTGSQLPIGQLLDLVPVDCGLLSSVIRESDEGLAESFDDEDAPKNEDEEPGSIFIGECEATSTSEHSKISLSRLSSPQGGQNVFGLLVRLLQDPRFERHFSEDDRNGIHAETPEELVGAIADWVDQDQNERINDVSDEDSNYARLRDFYKAKNAPMDSLAELQLVHGVDDELYDLLRDQLTIYTGSEQIDLNTASETQLLFGLLGAMRPEVTMEQANLGITQLYFQLAEMRSAMMGMSTMNIAVLSSMVETAGLGAFIDTSRFKDIFTDQPQTTWYTINASGRAGNVQRSVTAVFQAQEGKFYYYRVE